MLTEYRPHQRARGASAFILAFVLVASWAATLPTSTAGRGARAGGERQPPAANVATETPAAPSQAQAAETYGKLEMRFEPNHGQSDSQVKFLARGAGYTVFLTATEAVFVMRKSDCGPRNGLSEPPADRDPRWRSATGVVDAGGSGNPQAGICNPPAKVLRMKLEGANPASEAGGLQKLDGIVNYFIGSDRGKWETAIPTFGRVRYTGIYNGVDLVYYGNQRQLEYDFVVRPGADYNQIALNFEGADGLEVDSASGDLLLRIDENTVRQHKPLVYQEVGGERREVQSGYEIKGGGRVGFRVDAYDPSRPLIIDPVLAYSTYLGGSGLDGSEGIAVDSAGNPYVTGTTLSIDFPTTPGAFDTTDNARDVFVTKLNASGTGLVYSTYLGGNNSDFGFGIAVDASANAYVTGDTSSTDFPTTPGAYDEGLNAADDAFVTKLSASGALIYSTYLGGNDFDSGHDIGVDSTGNASVTGSTLSTDFPTTPGVYDEGDNADEDAFVTKLNASGTAIVYATYLGGNGADFGNSIAVDSAGNVYVTGETFSTDFPTTLGALDTALNGIDDAFVTKLNASGGLIYSTYLGGNTVDLGNNIAVDSTGNAYVTGRTASSDFPITPGAFDTIANVSAFGDPTFDGFVTKLNAAGTALVYSTYLGGNDADFGFGIAVDSSGNACVTGTTLSTDFPTTPGAFDTTDNLGSDVFVTKLNASGTALVYSTYLGGNDPDSGQDIAVDPAGNVYVAGDTNSFDFPTTTDAFQIGGGGTSSDGFVAKIGDYAISGRVIDSSGNGIADVTVTLSGSRSDSRVTGASGSFLFLDTVPSGSFAVTSAKEGFTFNPSSFSIGNLDTNVAEILFTGTSTVPTPTPAVVQFSAASYSVNENARQFRVIVTRSGDTSQPVSVDYETTDGTANDRGDYTTALGTLHFAAGDTAQSFDVFITDDVFSEGNETINLALSNPSAGATPGSQNSVVLTIVDNDLVNGTANPIDSTEFFVRQHYIDFLNRESDADGLAFWMNNIESCGADQACRAAKRIDTSAAFFFSIEFQQTGFMVHRATRAAFNRLARHRELLRDTQQIGAGVVVGIGSWETELEQNKEEYFNEFIARAEFVSVYAGLTNEQYVDALNANTGGSLSASERLALVGGLNAMTETRATVLRKVVEDADFAARDFNPAFVLMEYCGYLRRNPDDPPDTDFGGFNFWLTKLNQFNGDFRKADMVKAFITSTEYRQRFGP